MTYMVTYCLFAWWNTQICGLEALRCLLGYVWGWSLVETLHSRYFKTKREPCCCCDMNQWQWKLPCKLQHLSCTRASSPQTLWFLAFPFLGWLGFFELFFLTVYHRRLDLDVCCLCSCQPAFCKSKLSAFPYWTGAALRAQRSTSTLIVQKWVCCSACGCGTGIRRLAWVPQSSLKLKTRQMQVLCCLTFLG